MIRIFKKYNTELVVPNLLKIRELFLVDNELIDGSLRNSLSNLYFSYRLLRLFCLLNNHLENVPQ